MRAKEGGHHTSCFLPLGLRGILTWLLRIDQNLGPECLVLGSNQPHAIPIGVGHQLCPPRHPGEGTRDSNQTFLPGRAPVPSPWRALPTS